MGALNEKSGRPCACLTSEQCEPGRTFEAWSCLQCRLHLGSSRVALKSWGDAAAAGISLL